MNRYNSKIKASVHSQCVGRWHGVAGVKEIRLSDENGAFNRNLKTHPFVILFNESIFASEIYEPLLSVLEYYPHICSAI